MKTTKITNAKGLPQTTHCHLVQNDYPNAWPSAPAGFTVFYLKLSVDQGPHKLAHLHDHFYTLAEGNEADVISARKHMRKEIRKLGGSIKQAEYDVSPVSGYPTWTWHQPSTWVDPELVDQGNAGLTLNPKPDLKPVLAPGEKLDGLLAEIEEKFWELYHSCEHDFDAVWNNILDSDRRFYQVSDQDVSKLEKALQDRI